MDNNMDDTFYKGFINIKGKQAIESFKGATKLKTWDEAVARGDVAGVLDDDIILVDVDTLEQSDVVFKWVKQFAVNCRVYKTSRGRHFLFQRGDVDRCKTGVRLAGGVVADIKVGNRTSYQVLTQDGKVREIEYDTDAVDVLPVWLRPVKSDIDFFTMSAGDGRNTAFFTYILALLKAGLNKEQARDTIRMINAELDEPLDESELDVITRDDAFPSEIFFKENSFLHHRFASYIAENENVKRINGQLHIYRDGVYVAGDRFIELAMVSYIPTLRASQRTEVMKYLHLIAEDVPETANANFIAFDNGILDITTDTIRPFSPEFIITNKIPHQYNPSAYSTLADNTLNKLACHDPSIRALLEECIGYCFYRRNELSKAFILTGEKANGKSTFLDMVKNVLGEDNVSALDLGEMDERFSVATMAGKLANIGDDISDEFLHGRAIANFKKVVSGNAIKAEIKNDANVFFMRPYVKLLFSANDIPRMKDKTGAVLRRLEIIPFNARFTASDADFDPYITWKLKADDVMEYLIRIGVDGLKRILRENRFTASEKVATELDEFEVQNNPILMFIRDLDMDDIANQETKEVHRAYKRFCMENGFQELSLIAFSKELGRRLSVVTKRRRINGKLVSYYERG